jgi:hypothetical protein
MEDIIKDLYTSIIARFGNNNSVCTGNALELLV